MLYLSQRKISQITGSFNEGRRQDGPPPPPAPAERRQPGPELSPPSAWQPPVPPPAERQPVAGLRQAPAWGAVESHPPEGGYPQPMRTVARPSYQEQQAGNQAYVNSGPDGPPIQQQQSNQPQPQPLTPSNPNELEVKVDPDGKAYLNAEITKTDNKIKENKKSFKFRLMIAAFLGFCSICIGIGANMKYGVGEMSAFESLAGQHGKDGTAENLWNSGSTTDPLRGINYGFAIAGFTLPIVGTIFSLIGAFINFNQIKKGEKNNKLREIAKTGFSVSKTPDPNIHPNVEKLQAEINKNSGPNTEFCPTLAVALAKAHVREIKSLGL